MASWALRWAVLFSLWLALVDTVKIAELATGAVAAAIAATAGQLAMPRRGERSRPRLSWLLGAWRPVFRWPLETAQVCRVTLASLLKRRRPRGRFRASRFAVAPSGPRSRSRRALVEVLGSLTPNRYVIGVDTERDYVLGHELVRDEQPLDPLGPR